MITPLKVLKTPTTLLSYKPFMVMVPNKRKGEEAVAPYFFDTKEEASEFINKQLPKVTYWWEQD